MHLIAVIGFIFFGTLCVALAAWHEYTWWKRRHWSNGQGRIVGFTESYNDGVCYYPKIEFTGADGQIQFVSIYGSGREPKIGKSVDLLVDQLSLSAEVASLSNRLLFTIIPILFGAVFILAGINTRPLRPAEPAGTDQSATTPASKPEINSNPQVVLEWLSQ
ncbi:hypothetical protein JIN85_20210 [Luteolibacter pohnpeiensis]|uniref:DUF3592 domain-containing protein n=1 Tax=Luteolibacter pohnpeiensis TaxID=454153 RepID=A0A934S9S7_9BACT|nr:DUF3592 domain-containing protein [Luteolibacter pohnpeiensis]MBK1884747.1 hypothetical protein [Luteolibacter pohnpeiensis]